MLIPGELGYFDENDVSYPSVVQSEQKLFLYYTGWMPTILTPFQNHIGSAKRVSRVPMMDRSDHDPLGTGSMCVIKHKDKWHMWYTSFQKWQPSEQGLKHTYVLKYTSSDWERSDAICLDVVGEAEYVLCHSSVIVNQGLYLAMRDVS